MSRWTLRTSNDWTWLSDSGGGVDLLRLTVVNDAWHASIAFELLGFGIGLTYWKRAAREWEPIEHDGWGGEPQGMEHGP